METTEYMRFTIEEANTGKVEGWTLVGSWQPVQLTHWAWFRREVGDG